MQGKSIFAATALALAGLALTPAPLAAKDAAPVKVQGDDALKGASQIAIAAFNVGFIFESTDKTKSTGGLMGAFGGATKASSELTGVTTAMMQQIADAAYADFQRQVTAAGFTLVPANSVFASADIAKVKGRESPLEASIQLEKGSKGKATFFKPSQLPVHLVLPGDFAASGLGGIGAAFAGMGAQQAFATYAKNAGVAAVDVTYLIDFSDQKRPGAFSFGGGVSVNANLSVVPTFSKATIFGPSGKVMTLTLGQQQSVDGDFIAMSDATSGASKTAQAAGNVAGGMLAAVSGFGGLHFGKTRKFAFAAKPGNYEAGAAKAASLANTVVVTQMAGMR